MHIGTPHFFLAALAGAALLHCSSSGNDPQMQGTGSTSSSGNTSTSSSSGSMPTVNATVTEITPDQALKPKYVGVLPTGNLVITEGQPLRFAEVTPTGHVVSVDSTSFTGFEWPRGVASGPDNHVLIHAYNGIHTFAGAGLSGARQVWASAGSSPKRWEWMTQGGNPKRIWAIPGPGGTKTTFQRFDSATGTMGGTPVTAVEVNAITVMSFAVDDQNNIFAVDSNACRVRKITPAGVVTVIAGKPENEQGVCNIGSAIGRDSNGRPTLPQAGSIGWDPTGKILVLSGAGMLIDVTEGADGLSKTTMLHKFADGVQNEYFATTSDALYVVDVARDKVLKVTF